MESKPWYMSKTLWVNALMLILSMVQSDMVLSLNIVSPEVIAVIITAVNFILRFLTTQPVTAKK